MKTTHKQPATPARRRNYEKRVIYEQFTFKFGYILFAEFFGLLIIIPITAFLMQPMPDFNSDRFGTLITLFIFIFIINGVLGFTFAYLKQRELYDYFNILSLTHTYVLKEFLNYRIKAFNFPLNFSIGHFFRVAFFSAISLYVALINKLISQNFLHIHALIFLFLTILSSISSFYCYSAVESPYFKAMSFIRLEAENNAKFFTQFPIIYKTIITFILPLAMTVLIIITMSYSVVNFWLKTNQIRNPTLISNTLNTIYIRLILLSIISTISYSVLYSNFITKYVKGISNNLSKMHGGDITNTTEISSVDEFANISHDINSVNLNFNYLIRDIKELFSEIEKYVDLNFELSKEIDTNSTSQEENVNSYVKIINKIRDISDDIDKKAYQSTLIVNNSIKNLQNDINVFEQSFESIYQISDITNKTTESLKLIIDIASHTKLLALNASIEASRVGDIGKGFTVVSSEIRKMAESATAVSDQISELIKSVTLKIKDTITKSKQVKDSISSILREVQTIQNQVETISSDSKNQALNVKNLMSTSDDIYSLTSEGRSISNTLDDYSTHLLKLTKDLFEKLNLVKSISTFNNIISKKDIDEFSLNKYQDTSKASIENILFLPEEEQKNITLPEL